MLSLESLDGFSHAMHDVGHTGQPLCGRAGGHRLLDLANHRFCHPFDLCGVTTEGRLNVVQAAIHEMRLLLDSPVGGQDLQTLDPGPFHALAQHRACVNRYESLIALGVAEAYLRGARQVVRLEIGLRSCHNSSGPSSQRGRLQAYHQPSPKKADFRCRVPIQRPDDYGHAWDLRAAAGSRCPGRVPGTGSPAAHAARPGSARPPWHDAPTMRGCGPHRR